MGALPGGAADMVLSLLGGWPEGEEEAKDDSITDCHMFVEVHLPTSRDLPCCPVFWCLCDDDGHSPHQLHLHHFPRIEMRDERRH